MNGTICTGRVVRVIGPVVDLEFPDGELPEIFEAVHVTMGTGKTLTLEVQSQLGDNWVRTVAMDATDGMKRGMEAIFQPVRPSRFRSAKSAGPHL